MANEFVDTTLMDGFADGPHITEVQTGLANQGLYGPEDYVLESGRKAEAQVLTNNSIRIFDAVFVIQGRRDVIAANDYADVSIDNGAQGMNRNDIIVRRYVKDESTEIEHTEYAVIKGTAVSGEASDPDVTVGDIRSGATLHEMKLYRVKLQGLNIVAVEPLFKVLLNMSTINDSLSYLIGNSYKLYTGNLGGLDTRPYTLKKYNDGTFELCGRLDVSAVRLQYSDSTKMYYTMISTQIPDELTIDLDKKVQFSSSVESSGIYFVTLNSMTSDTLAAYISAMNYESEVSYIGIGFILKGWWK